MHTTIAIAINQKAASCPECLAFGCVPLPKILPYSVRLDEWLKKGFCANMNWMAGNFNMEKYNAAWVGLWKYPRPLQKKQEPIAAYAHGIDYHISIGSILKEWAAEIDGQPFVDSLRIAERELAVMAGLGFIGKNTMLINPKHGSGFFIGGILLNMESQEIKKSCKSFNQVNQGSDNCAKCRKCIDACPNKALTENGFLDSRKCASYLTIEHRGEFSEEQREWAKHSIFGCDICQRVCPYNAKHLSKTEPYFLPSENEWKKKMIKGSPLWRAGTKNLKRNTENYIAARQAAVCLPPAFESIFATSGKVEPAPIASAQSIGV